MEFTQAELAYLWVLVQARKVELTKQRDKSTSKALDNHYINCLNKVNSIEVKLKDMLASKRKVKKIPGPGDNF